MKQFNVNDFIDFTSIKFKQKDIRNGQHLMNCLGEYDMNTYLQITSLPECDPFYSDSNISNFWKKLGELSQ